MKTQFFVGALALSLAISSSFAVPVTPTGTFGSLPEANFGGTGIPNDAAEVDDSNGVKLGLEAHQRYVGPNLVNDGAGTYQAFAGVGITPGYASWNIGLFGKLDSLAAAGATATLYYDLDPGVGTDASLLHSIFLGPLSVTAGQDSWNLGMGFLSGGSFDPNATGEYSFKLVANSATGLPLSTVAINVEVGRASGVPDTTSTASCLGAAMLGLGLLRRKMTLTA